MPAWRGSSHTRLICHKWLTAVAVKQLQHACKPLPIASSFLFSKYFRHNVMCYCLILYSSGIFAVIQSLSSCHLNNFYSTWSCFTSIAYVGHCPCWKLVFQTIKSILNIWWHWWVFLSTYVHANVTIKTDYNYIITLLHTCTAYLCFL